MYRMLFALPMFLLLAWWAGRGKPALTWRDVRTVLALGILRLLSVEFSRFPRAALCQRELGTSDFVPQSDSGAGAWRAACSAGKSRAHKFSRWPSAIAACCACSDARLSVQGANVPLGATLVFASAVSYAVYLSYSGEEVQAPWRVAAHGSGNHGGLPHLYRAILPAEAGCRPCAVPAAVLWLSVLNATLCTFAPVVMVMMAIERIGASLTAQAGTIGPLSTILMAVILLGEPFTAWVLAGTVLGWLLAGSGCCHQESQARSAAERASSCTASGTRRRTPCCRALAERHRLLRYDHAAMASRAQSRLRLRVRRRASPPQAIPGCRCSLRPQHGLRGRLPRPATAYPGRASSSRPADRAMPGLDERPAPRCGSTCASSAHFARRTLAARRNRIERPLMHVARSVAGICACCAGPRAGLLYDHAALAGGARRSGQGLPDQRLTLAHRTPWVPATSSS